MSTSDLGMPTRANWAEEAVAEAEREGPHAGGRIGAEHLSREQQVMELRPHFEWRGLGFISDSALRVTERYAAFDAERIFRIPGGRVADP
ncbi:MAG: hydrogenase expression/formation protein HypD, partial [Pseudonocardiales bacterium]|nr:hydrogenase expression/formation protein HypD [Pseudonocardiales bacterium]